MIRTLTLDSHPFTVDNRLLTPTMKKKRTVLVQHYAGALSTMLAKSTKA